MRAPALRFYSIYSDYICSSYNSGLVRNAMVMTLKTNYSLQIRTNLPCLTQEITIIYFCVVPPDSTKSNTVTIGNSLGNYSFYTAPAFLTHDKDRAFGTVIAESKNRLIIVDDVIKKVHVYLIPKKNIDNYGDKRVDINISEESLKEFEM